MQLLESFTLGHGRVEPDFVENGPMCRVVGLEGLYPILGTADLGIDTLGRDVDPPDDIHGPQVRQEKVLDLQEVCLGDGTELVEGQGNIVLGRRVRSPLDVIAQESAVDFEQFFGGLESWRAHDLDAAVSENLAVWLVGDDSLVG